jgi:hypothetical protein
MSKINLWKEGFNTENYNILQLSLMDEMSLVILSEYFKSFMAEEMKIIEEKEIVYTIINTKKVTENYKNEEFIENINEAERLIIDVLGEEYAKTLSFYNYFFLIPSLYYEIISYKETLKKK